MADVKPPSQPQFSANRNDLQPIILGSDDYARLRQYALSDELMEELARAIVVQMERVPEDVVTMHSRCTYIDQRIGAQREIELVYPDEADPASGKISVLAPVGSALIGLCVGQEITWDFPDGSVRSLKVAGVTPAAR